MPAGWPVALWHGRRSPALRAGARAAAAARRPAGWPGPGLSQRQPGCGRAALRESGPGRHITGSASDRFLNPGLPRSGPGAGAWTWRVHRAAAAAAPSGRPVTVALQPPGPRVSLSASDRRTPGPGSDLRVTRT